MYYTTSIMRRSYVAFFNSIYISFKPHKLKKNLNDKNFRFFFKFKTNKNRLLLQKDKRLTQTTSHILVDICQKMHTTTPSNVSLNFPTPNSVLVENFNYWLVSNSTIRMGRERKVFEGVIALLSLGTRVDVSLWWIMNTSFSRWR